MKTLIDYFREKSCDNLDKQSKVILYKRILKKIHVKKWLHTTLISRLYKSKHFIISSIILFVLIFWYIYNPEIDIQNIRFWSVAQADYIWTIVSRNGSYQIIDNEHGWNTDSFTHIPKWWSLVVEWWSEVSVKTSNNALAKVIWPAKITFIKKDNQIIVDVSYGNSIYIEKKSNEWLLTVNTDVLVVKTESKTIIWKTSDLNISLSSNSWSKQLLTSLAWELIVSDDLWNSESVFMKEKDSIILDSELKLFAIVDKKENNLPLEKKKKSVFEGNVYNKDDSLQALNTNASWYNIMSFDIDPIFTSLSWNLFESWLNQESWVLAINIISDDIKEEQNLFLDNDNSFLRENSYMDKSDPITVANNESELQKLLYVKPILDGRLLELLDKLYESYYYTYDKDISKVKNLIFSLCNELKIQCDENNLIKSLNWINGKVVNSYVITPDIKLVQ